MFVIRERRIKITAAATVIDFFPRLVM